MYPYISVSYASENARSAERICDLLSRYGFRYERVPDGREPSARAGVISGAEALVVLTSPAAAAREVIASDVRLGLGLSRPVLCVSVEPNELDDRFCGGGEAGAILIPSPAQDSDPLAVALFVHRLMIRRLCRLDECFTSLLCADDAYGRAIECAVRAHVGDADAQFALGCAYESGDGVPTREDEAALWLERAALAGLTCAQVRIGEYYLRGVGVERDPARALSFFSSAARAGDVRGVYHVGLCYLYGRGVLRDPSYAVTFLLRAARQGYAPACYRLGILYRDGEGVPANHKRAVACMYAAVVSSATAIRADGGMSPGGMSVTLRRRAPGGFRAVSLRHMRRSRLVPLMEARAAAKGHGWTDAERSHATLRLMGRCRYTSCGYAEDGWLAGEYNRFLADEGGAWDARWRESRTSAGRSRVDERGAVELPVWTCREAAEAAAELGHLLALGCPEGGILPAPTRALSWYRFAAGQGSSRAMFYLGDAYRTGRGVPRDPEGAVRLYTYAANLKCEEAQFALGVCCERGEGTDQNFTEAARRYEQAARQGYAPAACNLGGCYLDGRGVARDDTVAVEWFTRASDARESAAACRLALCYELGRGVERDAEEAFALYHTAARGGSAYALYRLGLMYDHGILSDCDAGEHRLTDDVTLLEQLLFENSVRETVSAEEAHDDGAHLAVSVGDRTTPADDGGVYLLPPRAAYAARLYEQAAVSGVPDAAYAMAMCCRDFRGDHLREQRRERRHEWQEVPWLIRAADGGHLQAIYELGMCYFDGRGTVRDRVRAYACFERAADLWRQWQDSEPAAESAAKPAAEALPTGGLSRRDAAGCAIYMMGYCTLYSLLDGRREPLIPAPGSPEVLRAAELFSEAAETDHISAITALGDLAAYGFLPADTAGAVDTAGAADTVDTAGADDGGRDSRAAALELYERAARLAGTVEKSIAPHAVDAMLSLAEHLLREGKALESAGDREGADRARTEAWRYLAGAAELGSTDAQVGMAYCAHFGYGTPENRDTAAWFLRRAEHSAGGHRLASLFMGDILYAGGADRPAAMAAYRRAAAEHTHERSTESVTLAVRRRVRAETEERVRAEALYRLAAIGAAYLDTRDTAGALDASESPFGYLLQAVLAGHETAVRDLALMYAHEVERRDSAARPAIPNAKRSRSHRARATVEALAVYRSQMTLPPLTACMTDYYTALWPCPVPFERRMTVGAMDGDLPTYATAPVSVAMRAEALNYLGDCCFFGHGLPEDAAAAVACYTAAVAVAAELKPRRGDRLPEGVAWAHYSLGWCRLRGVGCLPNEHEAVRHFRAAPSHAEACFALADCCERGVGMDASNVYEAFKYYRRAHKLGHPKAAHHVRLMEQRLRDAHGE